MPCTYYTPEEETRISYNEKQRLREELDKVTRLLCQLMNQYENSEPDDRIYPDIELMEWWKDHKERDKARIAAEEAARKLAAEIEKKKEDKERAEYERLKKKYDKKRKKNT